MPSSLLPQATPKWAHTPEEIAQAAKDAIDADRELQDRVAALSPDECNFESVFVALEKGDTALNGAKMTLSFYQYAAADAALRNASSAAETAFDEYATDKSLRVDIYHSKASAWANIEKSGMELESEDRRLVDKMTLDGKRNGLHLSEEKRSELAELKKALAQTVQEYMKNYRSKNGSLEFTEDELKGVPATVISGYSKSEKDGRELYTVTHRQPDVLPVLKYAQVPKTRCRAYGSYESRLAVNVPALEKAADIRRRMAALYGYNTWADYVTEAKMVGSGQKFLADLEQTLRPVGLKERETLLALKKEDCETLGIQFDGVYRAEDTRYLDEKYLRNALSLDSSKVQEYFPVSHVVPVVLEIYQGLLGVRIDEVKNGEVWHPDAQMFTVWDANSNDFLGYGYLDLYARPDKFPHAAVWFLQAGSTSGSERQYPVSAMLANLANPAADGQATAAHSAVVTLFHEMGHLFHNLLSRTKYGRFHGTSVAGDFVEAPAKMLENWCWEPIVLKRLSSHFETKEPLSDELIDRIVKSRFVNHGLFQLNQLFHAKFDIALHASKEPLDSTSLWNSMREQIRLAKEETAYPGQAAFPHIMGGMDAGYYGSLYALCFATDMYWAVFKADPLDPEQGMRYRKSILEPGGSRDELVSLEEFLGRPPSSEALMRLLSGS
ncbi:Metalloprotease [Peniophora sp. CONT]|nr:Metalloprotease [Peniophora sp. CONT]